MTSFPLAIALFLILTSFSGCTAQVFRAPSTLIDRNAALNLKPALGSTGLLPVVSNGKLSGLLERQAGLCKTGMSACEGNAGSCCPTGGSCCVDPATTRVNACCGAGLKCCVATGYREFTFRICMMRRLGLSFRMQPLGVVISVMTASTPKVNRPVVQPARHALPAQTQRTYHAQMPISAAVRHSPPRSLLQNRELNNRTTNTHPHSCRLHLRRRRQSIQRMRVWIDVQHT